MQPSLQAPASLNVTLALPSSALCSITARSRVSPTTWKSGGSEPTRRFVTHFGMRLRTLNTNGHAAPKTPAPKAPALDATHRPIKNQLRERPIESPLLAQSGHAELHCTCPLSGAKRTLQTACVISIRRLPLKRRLYVF
jgi:hypothetical protein